MSDQFEVVGPLSLDLKILGGRDDLNEVRELFSPLGDDQLVTVYWSNCTIRAMGSTWKAWVDLAALNMGELE